MVRLEQIKSAINSPSKIPPYVAGKLFPNSKYSAWYKVEDGKIVRDNYNDRLLAEFGKDVHANFKLFESIFEDIHCDRILDVGCGMGWRLPWYSEYAEEAVGVDISENSIGIASDVYNDYEFKCAPAQDLPFNDDRFDIVCTWTVLMHMSDEDVIAAAEEITRVMEENGKLIVYEDNRNKGRVSDHIWSRNISEYRQIFQEFEFLDSFKREPEFESNGTEDHDIQIYKLNQQ